MKLAQLLSVYSSFKIGEHPYAEVTGLSLSTKNLQKGNLFIATRGTQSDGHDFILEACKREVSGIVVERTEMIPKDFKGAVLTVKNAREAAVRLASRFYDEPAEKLFCVGVTGTNGKTSTTYMIESVLNHFGLKTGVMGTINHHLGDKVWGSELTTPDPITLFKRLREFVALEAKAVAFEVSSHALDQNRVQGVPFSAVVFTNLTRDHLDYHKTMENYFAAKEKLFNELIQKPAGQDVHAIVNVSDEWGRKIHVADNAKKITYGEIQSNYQFQVLQTHFNGTKFRLHTSKGDYEVQLQVPGRHNVYNAVAAMAVGVSAGASMESCIEGIQKFCGVPGRLQKVLSKKNFTVFIDYAHTDDALKTVLSILQEIRSQAKIKSRIITVFGCGGDRDKGKRPLMAQAAMNGSDCVWVTSDNPRTEDPMRIIEDILAGTPKTSLQDQVFVEVDRREAIRKAIAMAENDDVVLIAGKGHETYQIIGDKKFDFSDYKVAEEYLNGL